MIDYLVYILGMTYYLSWIIGNKYWIVFEERLNYPYVEIMEKREFDLVYQYSYCHKGHPEHPCNLWICPKCSICSEKKYLENKYREHHL